MDADTVSPSQKCPCFTGVRLHQRRKDPDVPPFLPLVIAQVWTRCWQPKSHSYASTSQVFYQINSISAYFSYSWTASILSTTNFVQTIASDISHCPSLTLRLDPAAPTADSKSTRILKVLGGPVWNSWLSVRVFLILCISGLYWTILTNFHAVIKEVPLATALIKSCQTTAKLC